jgi:hypothetical protein
MALTLRLEFDSRQIGKLTDKRVLKAVTQAARNAVDLGLRHLKTSSAKAIRGKVRLSSAFVRGGLRTKRPERGASLYRIRGDMWASGEPIALSKYPYRQTRTGVTSRASKGRNQVIRHAFSQRVKTGHVGIFIRQTRDRYPLKHFYGPTLRNVLQREDAYQPVYDQTHARMRDAFNVQVARQLARAGL